MTQSITGGLFRDMIISAAAAIENHKQEVNELNVFPVPDGDTGTNMSLTIGAAESALAPLSPGTLGYVAEVTAGAMLRGARGNSGVILSLLFRGFAKRVKDLDAVSADVFAQALAAGVDSAYKAVMKPAEGTILTVSRLAAGAAGAAAESEDDIEAVLESALESGYAALADTINQNPVLKKAGVIDAGAKGYLYILDAMLRAMRGEIIARLSVGGETGDKADFTRYTSESIEFAYCTEFLIERKHRTDVNNFRDFLDKRGDSIVVVDDDEVIKVHVHSNEPGAIITEALTFGALLSVKVQNMREQHSEMLTETGVPAGSDGAADARPVPPAPAEMKEFATVVICAGSGIEDVFRDLGADGVITGGQTMNPSTEDILGKILSVPSDVVFVLPNNKNIILAAQQCIPLTDKRVYVIPTKTIPQGVSAMLAIDSGVGFDDMETLMAEAAQRVCTAHITSAARDSVFDGQEIKEGEYIALIEDSLAANDPDIAAVIDKVAAALGGLDPEFITVFTGEDVGEAEASAVAERIGAFSSGAEVSIIPGGQPVYHYIISAE